MVADLQSRTTEHGIGRHYPETETGLGRLLVSTFAPHGKRGDYLNGSGQYAYFYGDGADRHAQESLRTVLGGDGGIE